MRQDFRYALRQLPRNPGFSAVVIATLALGIGGTTAVFSVLQAVLLVPLSYEEPGRLVRFYQQEPDKPDTRNHLTGTHFTSLRDEAASFEAVTALANYSETGRDLVSDGRAQRLRVLRVTSEYFQTFRSGPLRGPGFDRSDEAGSRRVVLSSRLWREGFRSDPSAVGATVQLSGEPYEVVGIAPGGFHDPIAGDVDAWLPYSLARDTDEENNSLTAVGRLRNGVTLEQARAELSGLSRSMSGRWPLARLSAVVAVPLQEDLVATSRGPLQLLLVAVGLVLLVACVNVANLMLARATGRVHEFALRSALGAGRRRLVRQMLVESLVLAALGGLIGLALAAVMVELLQSLGRGAIPRLDEVGFDPAVLGFAALVTVATAVACGVAPAVRLGHTAPVAALGQQARGTGTRGQGRLRNVLAAAQLALALTLLMGAGVLLASFHRLQRVELGFRVDGVLTFELNLPGVRYDAARRAAFHEDLARRLRAVPGVAAAGGISFLPATGDYHSWNTFIASGPKAGTSVTKRDGFNVQQRTVSGDIFAALGIPVLAGRTFDAQDDQRAPSRVVVSANFARTAFPGLPFEGVIGQRVAAGGRRSLEIVGVVGDVTLDVYGSPALVVYHAHRQFADNRNWALAQVVATQGPPERVLADVRTVVATMDPELVVYRAAPMTDVVGRGTSRERFALVLMGTFAGVSLLLATLGLYGVIAYAVRQRTQEIGIRIALGATAAQIRAVVMRQAGVVIGAGLLAGTAGALVLGRWLTTLAFEISPSDPRILLASATLLTVVALAASVVPAGRASVISPMVAIRDQPESLWRTAQLKARHVIRELTTGGARAGATDTLTSDVAGAIHRAATFSEAVEVALATLRERVNARSILLLERVADEYRCSVCAIPVDGVLISRLRRYPHPLPLTAGDLQAWAQWAREAGPSHSAEIEILARSGARMAVPLRSRHDLVGVLLLGAPPGREDFAASETHVLGGAADVFTLLIENARLNARTLEEDRLRRDVALAAAVQRRLLPLQPPGCVAATFAAFTQPARTVGGDYYDFLELPGERIGIAVADIAGKGIPAALLMSAVQASLRVIAEEPGLSTSQLAAKMNRFLYASTATSSYATFFYAQLDLRTGRLCYVNAGHNPPYLLRRNAAGVQITELSAGGTVLGLFQDVRYEEGIVDMCAGDLLVAYTDGVTEARSAAGEEFGEAQLQDCLRQTFALSADEVSSTLAARLREWMAGAEQVDDVTFVVAKAT